MKQTIYRKDYTPSNYLIHTTHLDFEFFDKYVIVTTVLDMYQNPENTSSNELFLNGEELELLSISVDECEPRFTQSEEGLTLYDMPRAFVLSTQVKIYPYNNTKLEGLYKSNAMFCTQCEAHGFRRITYYLDRTDVLSRFSVGIIADINMYPVQLSNGNFMDGRWVDPVPKPCYLFALVVGDLSITRDTFTTKSGKDISLEIFTEVRNKDKTAFAMTSLKNAMSWDESRFNLEYDLDTYMIVAVDDFNIGAMENKGLNIFNSSCVFASQQSATDDDYLRIEAVIAHEYFHNWTGNRVTCRDWFQLSLKEGLTVFRDQEFSADMRNKEIKRIEDVSFLKAYQFREDSSSLQHPVRPESYIEMNNFYTLTIYEKGAEIVRMLHTILGEENFQKGMQLYFERFDGKAVEIEDFVRCMCDITPFDFDKFMLWYQMSGTPKITITNNSNIINIVKDDERIIPLKYAIFNTQGIEIESGILMLEGVSQNIDFSHLEHDIYFSWNRDFSAPIIIKEDSTIKKQQCLAIHETNIFAQFENIQQLYQHYILSEEMLGSELDNILKITDNAQLSQLFSLPNENELYLLTPRIDPVAIQQKLEHFAYILAQKYIEFFTQQYQENNNAYRFNTKAIYQRKWKNICLFYLAQCGEFDIVYKQFKYADCMTDKFTSFKLLLASENTYRAQVVAEFYEEFKHDSLVLNKWFAVQSQSKTYGVSNVAQLLQHEAFDIHNPNKVRALLGGFTRNIEFHTQSGYEFFADKILELDSINPQVAARLVSSLTDFSQYEKKYKDLQQTQLERIITHNNLSPDVHELVKKSLE